MRFEEPVSTDRWDSPLFKVQLGEDDEDDDNENFEEYFSSLTMNEKKSPLEDMYLWLFEVRLVQVRIFQACSHSKFAC